MSKYFIRIVCLFGFILGNAQTDTLAVSPSEEAVYTQPYGIRLGIDLSRPVVSTANTNYTGLEIVGDYRLTQNLYLAGELGNEEKTIQERLGEDVSGGNIVLYDYTSSGSYLKLGVDLNTYENWFGMNNSIYIGGRYALSTLSQTLNNYTIYDSNRYWNPEGFIPGSGGNEEFSGLNASWLEFVFGTKVEMFANIYLGASVRLGFLISNKEEERFPNLWIPGFNKVTDGSNFGASYNYTLSYLIPLYKKAKKPKDPEEGEL